MFTIFINILRVFFILCYKLLSLFSILIFFFRLIHPSSSGAKKKAAARLKKELEAAVQDDEPRRPARAGAKKSYAEGILPLPLLYLPPFSLTPNIFFQRTALMTRAWTTRHPRRKVEGERRQPPLKRMGQSEGEGARRPRVEKEGMMKVVRCRSV